MSDYYSKSKQRKPLNTGDKRIRKTKQAIRNALFQIMEEKSIDKITVAEIVQKADINRSTFYFYYEDINDLLRQTENEVFETFVRSIVLTSFSFSKKEEFVQYLTKYMEFCLQNYIVCKFVTANACNNELANKIRSELKKTIPNSRTLYDEDDPRLYLTTFAISGFLFCDSGMDGRRHAHRSRGHGGISDRDVSERCNIYKKRQKKLCGCVISLPSAAVFILMCS